MLILPCCSVLSDGVCLLELKGLLTYLLLFYHHHHQLARSKSIAVSTMRRQEGRSVARRNAE